MCLLIFAVATSCQDDRESQELVKPQRKSSPRIGSNNPYIEQELVSMENYYGISFTNQEVDAIDDHPDPTYIIARVRAALEEFGNVASTALENTFNQIEQPYRSITEGEKQALADTPFGYRLALFLYVLDAVDATVRSGSICGDCRANAFKHALFRVLNGWSFSRGVSKTLGEEHEGSDLSVASQMDRHNNTQGLLVFDTVGMFAVQSASNEIDARMDRGELKYVNDYGILVSTDQ